LLLMVLAKSPSGISYWGCLVTWAALAGGIAVLTLSERARLSKRARAWLTESGLIEPLAAPTRSRHSQLVLVGSLLFLILSLALG
jgi:hypothetical protein